MFAAFKIENNKSEPSFFGKHAQTVVVFHSQKIRNNLQFLAIFWVLFEQFLKEMKMRSFWNYVQNNMVVRWKENCVWTWSVQNPIMMWTDQIVPWFKLLCHFHEIIILMEHSFDVLVLSVTLHFGQNETISHWFICSCSDVNIVFFSKSERSKWREGNFRFQLKPFFVVNICPIKSDQMVKNSYHVTSRHEETLILLKTFF